MSILSKLRPLLKTLAAAERTAAQRQMSGHRVFRVEPSRWQWNKFKDLVNLYLWVGLIPCGLFIGYQNWFTGPATLSEIPEGYTPKYWEYYKNPVTRFLAKYITTSPQQDYEKFCTYLYIEQEKIRLKQLEEKVKGLMKERQDYQAYYYRPVDAKYFRALREASDKIRELEDPTFKE